jgi:hypothetical protein
MSGEKINLEWLGNRVMTMSAEVRDLQLRFTALEGRFSAMEARIAALERMAVVQFDALASRFERDRASAGRAGGADVADAGSIGPHRRTARQ